jgi:uncharacterized membrane protein YhaH (DUF805 family)
MADVFISYSREDRPRAEQVARALSAMGLDSFWDTDIPPGQTWADYIEGKLTQCKTVVVLWSEHSTKSQWVREEARMGRDKSKLIPALLDASPAPFGFGEVQAADLSTWRGEASHPEWTRFAAAVQNAVRAGGDVTPSAQTQAPPQPPQPSGWRADPPPQAPQHAYAAPGAAAQAAGIEQHTPIGYIQTCFRLYVNGAGRARRAEFGWFVAFGFVLSLAAAFLDVSTFGINPYTGALNAYTFTILTTLALLAPTISAASRRAHDFGQSGWLAILCVIPYLGFIALVAFIFVPGQVGPNQFGPDPKGL